MTSTRIDGETDEETDGESDVAGGPAAAKSFFTVLIRTLPYML